MGPHGLLLTGGASSRMGRDKATLELGGASLAMRAARALAPVARPVLIVGPGAGTGIDAIQDGRAGPLAAFVAGAVALRQRGSHGAVLLVACDLPFVTARLLDLIARSLGDEDAAVPVLGGRDQPLAACYAPRAREEAARLLGSGADAMRDLLATLRVRRIAEEDWTKVAPPEALMDLDTGQDLDRAARIADASG